LSVLALKHSLENECFIEIPMFMSLLVISSHEDCMFPSYAKGTPTSVFFGAIKGLNWIVGNCNVVGHVGHLRMCDATADPELIRFGIEDNVVVSILQILTDPQSSVLCKWRSGVCM
jgi:hypothetical protein